MTFVFFRLMVSLKASHALRELVEEALELFSAGQRRQRKGSRVGLLCELWSLLGGMQVEKFPIRTSP